MVMASHHVATLFLFAGLFFLGSCQSGLEVGELHEWQPSRVRRVNTPSLSSNVQSSRSFVPRRPSLTNHHNNQHQQFAPQPDSAVEPAEALERIEPAHFSFNQRRYNDRHASVEDSRSSSFEASARGDGSQERTSGRVSHRPTERGDFDGVDRNAGINDRHFSPSGPAFTANRRQKDPQMGQSGENNSKSPSSLPRRSGSTGSNSQSGSAEQLNRQQTTRGGNRFNSRHQTHAKSSSSENDVEKPTDQEVFGSNRNDLSRTAVSRPIGQPPIQAQSDIRQVVRGPSRRFPPSASSASVESFDKSSELPIQQSSRESSRQRSSSERLNYDFPATSVTEGSSEILSTTTPKTQRETNRGRTKANLPTGTVSQRKGLRGGVKAKIGTDAKKGSDDEVSDEDNYPKEFIEKIKHSGETKQGNLSSKQNQGSRSLGARSLAPKTKFIPKSKVTSDSDVSESINDHSITQELPPAIKSRESFHKSRYTGKSLQTSTTESTTTTESSSTSTVSNVDVLRQRYLTKLKQSQEERNQKLAGMRPKLNIEDVRPLANAADVTPRTSSAQRNYAKSERTPVRTVENRFSRPPKRKFEPKSRVSGSSSDSSYIRFRPQSTFKPSAPENNEERAIASVAEHSRTRNKYSRLRKEELSVEAPEAKSWSSPRGEDSIYTFARLRTSDLALGASEPEEKSVSSNEIVMPSTTGTPSTSSGVTDTAATSESNESTSKESTTAVTTTSLSTQEPTTETITSTNGPETTVSSQTTKQDQPGATTSSGSDASEETTSQISLSTRHRFSSRYNSSTEAPTVSEVSATSTVSDQDVSTQVGGSSSTLSTLSLSTSSSPPDLSSVSNTSSTTLTSINSSDSISSTLASTFVKERIETSSLRSTTNSAAATTPKKPSTKSSKSSSVTAKGKTVATKKKTAAVKSTTPTPGFLDNRPILRNLVSLLANQPTRSTNKPKPTEKIPKKQSKSVTKFSTAKTPTSTASSTKIATSPMTIVTTANNNNNIQPLPLAVNAEEVINDTQELINNKTSFGSEFSKVPRDELDALTPETFTEGTSNSTTMPSQSQSSESSSTTMATSSLEITNSSLMPRIALLGSDRSTAEMENVTSQPIFFEYTSPSTTSLRPMSTVRSTTPSTTTVGDYYVFGIFPNNTVVKKRAFRAFDYEKYMSPYIIFGIYPNNTIVKKFPNGTIINDEFMNSDNEINNGDDTKPSSTTTIPSPTVTTVLTTSSTSTSPMPTTVSNPSVETTTMNVEETPSNDILDFDDVDFVQISTSERNEETTENPDDPDSYLVDFRLGDISVPTTQDIGTTTPQMEETTTTNPILNQVLPLSAADVDTFWNGNFSLSRKEQADATRPPESNVVSEDEQELNSLTSLAFRALSTSGPTSEIPKESTTSDNGLTTTTIPGMTTTIDSDSDDAITLSSQHVQKVTKAPARLLTDDVLTTVVGSLEEQASTPIPDILRDVGSEPEGDGLTATLARRIIALAMERAKVSTDSPTSETMTSSVMSSTTLAEATITKQDADNDVNDSSSSDSQKSSKEVQPEQGDLDIVLKELMKAENTSLSSSTMKAPEDLEKAVENQIRLAEEVRKASRSMKKKKKKSKTTTTPAPPPFNLGFLFNFFNRPEPITDDDANLQSSPKKPKSVSPSPTQSLFLASSPNMFGGDEDGENASGDGRNRGRLITAAIDVTKAVSKLMGTVLNNAAQSFQTFMRGNGWGSQ